MSQILNTSTNHSWQEADTLIGLLRTWGVEYLMTIEPISPISKDQLAPIELIKCLAQQNDNPRIRDASISLFLLHPELTDTILEAIKTSEQEIAEQITTSVLAALYLQRMWSVRLALALGHLPNLPEQPFAHLWQKRKLPPPNCHNGEWGLVALQAFEQERTGMPFVFFIGDWQNQMDHLLWQEEARHQKLTVPVAELLVYEKDDVSQEYEMSMRPNVDKKAIESFLQQLGRTFRKQGRLYLVGGAALVHAGIRSGFTQDIDIQVGETNEDDLIITLQQLAKQMQINIKFASPSDFIPVPSQWEMNTRYVGRYGSIDVFYFDFYSIALSKIERGSANDINDVMLLVQQGIIELEELDNAYNEVLPRVGKRPYNRLDPQKFAEHYISIRQLL